MFPRHPLRQWFLDPQPSFNSPLLTLSVANSAETEKARAEWRLTSIFALKSIRLLKSYDSITGSNITSTVLLSLLAFTQPGDTWNSKPAYEITTETLEYLSNEVLSEAFIVDYVLKGFLRPLFAASTPQTITSQGRKAPSENSGNQTIKVTRNLDAISKPWKCRDIYAVTVFKWVVTRADVRLQAFEHHQYTDIL
jgi:hypothetical protein